MLRMRNVRRVLCKAMLFAGVAARAYPGGVDVPTWHVNDQWNINKSYTLLLSDDNGSQFNINTVETYTLSVAEIAPITTSFGETYKAYRRVRSNGGITGSGTISDGGEPVPIRWKTSSPAPTNTGEFWTRVADLSDIRLQFTLSGVIQAQIFPLPPTFADAATVTFESTTELSPPAEEFDFPVETVGETWSTPSTARLHGRLRIVYNPSFPWPNGKPNDVDDPFDETIPSPAHLHTFVGQAARLGFPNTFHIQSAAPLDVFYEPSIKERVEIVSPELGEQGFLFQNYSRKVTGQSLQADPNITNLQFQPARPPQGSTAMLNGTTTPFRVVAAEVLEKNLYGFGFSNGAGVFQIPIEVPGEDDFSPASADKGSFGVEVTVNGVGRKVVTVQLDPKAETEPMNSARPEWTGYR